MANQNEETWPQILRNVWNIAARALRVVPRVNTGADYADLSGDSSGNLNVNVVSGTITGGGDGAILDGVTSSIKATVKDYTNSNPLTTILVDTNGDPAAVGGGTQYDEGATDPTITGTAAMWEDLSDTLRPISMAKPLPVQPGTDTSWRVKGVIPDGTLASLVDPILIGGEAFADGHLHSIQLYHTTAGYKGLLGINVDLDGHAEDFASSGEGWSRVGSTDNTKANGTFLKTAADGTVVLPAITGSVTANAGTNLNTSALAVESGGNLAAAVTALQIIDDWDDGADRAKVTGSAGMAALVCTMGSVVVNAGTNLNTSALALEAGNVSACASSLSIIDDWDESDRAKVNPIVGVAGVAAGDGVTGTTTQRVTMGVTEATYGQFNHAGVNLTSTSAWTLALATPGSPWRIIETIVTTDVDIQMSYDGTNKHKTVPSGYTGVLDLFPNGLRISGALYVRNDGTTPSKGRVYIHGITV